MPRLVIGFILGFLVVVPGGFVIAILSATCSAAIRVWWRRRKTLPEAVPQKTAEEIIDQETYHPHYLVNIERYRREKRRKNIVAPQERRGNLPHQRRA